jgi:hypothetical protein
MSLEICYLAALHAKNNNFVVSAQDILAVYNRERTQEDDPEERKRASWQALADSDPELPPPSSKPRPPCDYPGCSERRAPGVVARYCLHHGEAKSHWQVPTELYRAALEAKGAAR